MMEVKRYTIPMNNDNLGIDQLVIEIDGDGFIAFTDGHYNDYGDRTVVYLDPAVLPELIKTLTEIQNDPA